MLAALLLVGFMDEWLTFFPAGTLPSIRSDLGLSYAEAGIALASLSLGGLIGAPLGGLAADFLDRRLLLATGAFGYAVAMAVFGLSTDFVLLVAAGFVWGASSDLFIHPTEVALVDLYPRDLERMFARQDLLSAIGDILSPLTIALAITVGFDWRALFVGGGALMALYGLWFLTLRFPPPRGRDNGHTPWRSLVSVARDTRVLRLVLVLTLYSTLDEPFVAFVILFLNESLALSASAATLLGGVLVASYVVGYATVGRLIDRFGRRRLPFVLTSVMVVGVAGIVAAPHAIVSVVAAATVGMAGSAFYSVMSARLMALRPGQAGATSTVSSYSDTLALVLPPLVGLIADARGLLAGMLLYTAIPVAILALLITMSGNLPVGPDEEEES
jgi:MFS family permease